MDINGLARVVNGSPVANGITNGVNGHDGGYEDNLEIRQIEGKGRGLFADRDIHEGTEIILEEAAVLGPKQTSPFVCVECLCYIDETSVGPCPKCGVPLCQSCKNISPSKFKYHKEECVLIEKSAKFTDDPITTHKRAKEIYSYLSPLRFLLKAEQSPDLFKLDDKLEERSNTIIHFFALAHVVKPLIKTLDLKDRFTVEQIQAACGVLDTNCYEIKWRNGIGRGLFHRVALINHDCAPNCRKLFDANRKMHVIACHSIQTAQELTLSYTVPLLSTPLRQAILQQTKCFQCRCSRCRDPFELGSGLAAIKCKNKAKDCKGSATPLDPMDLKSDYQCQDCQEIIGSDTAQMMLDTAMKFIGTTSNPEDTLEVMANLARFLPMTNHLMVDLKLRLIDQVLADPDKRQEHEAKAIEFCHELLDLARIVAPGCSKLRGVLSLKFHQLAENGPNPLVISRIGLEEMFNQDQSVSLLD